MYHLQNLCTLCLQPNVTMKNIYCEDSDNVSIIQKLEFTVESLKNDFQGISLYICEECQNTLNKMYAFKVQSIRNMNNLKDYIHQLGVMSKQFKHLSVVLDRKCVKPTKLDQCHVDVHQNECYENMDMFIPEVVYTNVEDMNQNVTLQNQVEEDINIDLGLFAQQILNCEIEFNENVTENRTQDNPFECKFCGKVFELRHQLHHHTNIHFGKKHKCHICSKEFTRKSSLNLHIRIHNGEKPFTCHICSKEFTQNGNLIMHMRIHNGEKPFTCHICSKEFTQNGNLITHMRIHNREKPFTCHICSKEYTQNGNLIMHMRIHTGEKPFTCPVCPKAFSRKSLLNYHLRNHHTTKKPVYV